MEVTNMVIKSSFLRLGISALCALSVVSLTNKANAANATIDSINVTHNGNASSPNENDRVLAKVTFTFTSYGLYGAWVIDNDKSGDQLASGDGCAANPLGTTISGSQVHKSGGRVYRVGVAVYDTTKATTDPDFYAVKPKSKTSTLHNYPG
jgi:hypothetical protein